MLGFGLGSTDIWSVRKGVARCDRKSRASRPQARRWQCRFGRLEYECEEGMKQELALNGVT